MAESNLYQLFCITLLCLSQVFGDDTTHPPSIRVRCEGAENCIGRSHDFEAMCQRLSGVVDGGRCFFVGKTAVDWDNAWNQCGTAGGQLAQLHTDSEALQWLQLVQQSGGRIGAPDDVFWVALRRPLTQSSSPGLHHTYWYTNASEYHPKLAAGTSYIRKHIVQDTETTGYNCIGFYDQSKFQDYLCALPHKPLCMVTNKATTYMRYDNVCINEEPIEQVHQTPIECAETCAKRSWCRSFVYYHDQTCRLFSFDIKDKPSVIIGQPWCVQYSYVSYAH